ncbi:MAG: hypothetical protein OXR62_17210 [Ahrensia sp.]|nr:hypothetical protein [Ahrensia sp.]
MTQRARIGLSPLILSAALLSASAGSVSADNAATPFLTPGDLRISTHDAVTPYRPRVRIPDHPRNRNISSDTYTRDGRRVRVIDTGNASYIAAPSPFNASRFGFTGVPAGFESLLVKHLREGLNADEFERFLRLAQKHYDERYGTFDRRGYVTPASVPADFLFDRPSTGLTEQATVSPRRPGAKIIDVTEEQRELGERRSSGREARFLRENGGKHIRSYREHELYDERFPSVVYLISR